FLVDGGEVGDVGRDVEARRGARPGRLEGLGRDLAGGAARLLAHRDPHPARDEVGDAAHAPGSLGLSAAGAAGGAALSFSAAGGVPSSSSAGLASAVVAAAAGLGAAGAAGGAGAPGASGALGAMGITRAGMGSTNSDTVRWNRSSSARCRVSSRVSTAAAVPV